MRFKSPTQEPVTISATDGTGTTTVSVGPAFAELDPKFHDAAKAAGCLAEVVSEPKPVKKPAKPKAKHPAKAKRR